MSVNVVKLGDYIKIQTGKLDANASNENGIYPFFTCAVEPLQINTYAYDCECILVAGNGDLNVKYYNGKFNAYQRTYIIEIKNKELDIRYLYHFLTKYINILRKNSIGGVIKYIKLGDLTDIKLPLPSIDKQQKIVSILDKADEIRTKKKQANEKLDEFLKSTFIDMFGNPETNNKHWEAGTIRDIVKEAKYGTSSKAGSEGEYPILRMGNLTYNGAITLDDLKYIDLKSEELDKYLVRKGDILFNRTNSKELVGKTALFRYEQSMAFAGYLVRVRTNEKAKAEFLSAYMNSDYMKNMLQLKCKNIVGMANINAQELQDFGIYIPPMAFQDKFAQIVEKVEAQKQKNELVIEQMDNLFNSLSQRAFKGEL